jgi:uncharacterized protein (UPF0332 family)
MNKVQISELCKYKLGIARRTIAEAELLLDNKMWNAAVSRIYYACFYAVNALLVNGEIQARKHSGVIHMFSLHFIHTGIFSKEVGKFYGTIFDMRQSGTILITLTFRKPML